MKLKKLVFSIFIFGFALVSQQFSAGKFDKGSCSFNGIKLKGKVKVVKNWPDIKVKVVNSWPDLKVKKVSSWPDDCGEWQFVDNWPDFKIQFVDNWPDIKIKYVDNWPGVK